MAFLDKTGLEHLWAHIVSKINDAKIIVDDTLSSTSTNPVQNKVVTEAISDLQSLVGDTSVASQIATATANKVDKVDGKDLSANDYTDEDKSKLDGIEAGANKTIVDSELSSTSTNPVQNKVVNTSITTFNDVVGDTAYGNLLIDGTIVANHYNTVNITPPTSRKASAFRFDVIFPQLNDSNKDMIKTITVFYQGARIYTVTMNASTRSYDNTSYATSTCSCNSSSIALTNISTHGFDVIYLDSSGSEVAITDIAFPIYIRFCSIATPSLVTPGWWELPEPLNVDATLTVEGDAADAKATGDAIANKVDKVDGKGLSTNDYTTDEKNKLAGIAEGATKTIIDSTLSSTSANPVQNKVVNSAISNLNTLVGDTSVSSQISNAIVNKVDKVDGKGLSTNDYTTDEKNKLAGIEAGANKTIVDSALSSTSINPVQNKVVNTAISNLSQLVDNKVGTDELNTAVENALTEAKNSGEFNGPQGIQGPAGANGYTPVRGTDYWTAADQEQIVSDVLAALPNAQGVSF